MHDMFRDINSLPGFRPDSANVVRIAAYEIQPRGGNPLSSHLNISPLVTAGYAGAEAQTPLFVLSGIDDIDLGIQQQYAYCTPAPAARETAFITACALNGKPGDDVSRVYDLTFSFSIIAACRGNT